MMKDEFVNHCMYSISQQYTKTEPGEKKIGWHGGGREEWITEGEKRGESIEALKELK